MDTSNFACELGMGRLCLDPSQEGSMVPERQLKTYEKKLRCSLRSLIRLKQLVFRIGLAKLDPLIK